MTRRKGQRRKLTTATTAILLLLLPFLPLPFLTLLLHPSLNNSYLSIKKKSSNGKSTALEAAYLQQAVIEACLQFQLMELEENIFIFEFFEDSIFLFHKIMERSIQTNSSSYLRFLLLLLFFLFLYFLKPFLYCCCWSSYYHSNSSICFPFFYLRKYSSYQEIICENCEKTENCQ